MKFNYHKLFGDLKHSAEICIYLEINLMMCGKCSIRVRVKSTAEVFSMREEACGRMMMMVTLSKAMWQTLILSRYTDAVYSIYSVTTILSNGYDFGITSLYG